MQERPFELGLRLGLAGPRFRPGAIWLGVDPLFGRLEVGVRDDRHAICVAAARTGKGSSLIIPNCCTWSENLLVIDPAGETLPALRYRQNVFDQDVHVLDPLHVTSWPQRSSFNPLAGLDPESHTVSETIGRIVNALIVRDDPRAGFWYGGAASILAGLIAFMIVYEPEEASLPRLREFLNDPALLKEASGFMQTDSRCNGLMQAAVTTLSGADETVAGFFANATTNTDWINTASMRKTLAAGAANPVDLDALRTGKTSIALIIPNRYLVEHGRFLRLFVDMALDRMSAFDRGRECLFLLDEFHALGPMPSIEKAVGQLPKYGIRLFPFLQDITQLRHNYPQSWATFFANTSIRAFFGNTDTADLEFIARSVGTRRNAYLFVDGPTEQIRIAPGMIREHVEKRINRRFIDRITGQPASIARRMIAFIPGYEPGLSLRLTPYFRYPRFRRLGLSRTHENVAA